jgi:hypothetical protein
MVAPCDRAILAAQAVEKMSTSRADPVENLCAKINFCSECACFARERRRAVRFVIHFACSAAANA